MSTILPVKNEEYGTKDYWDQRYTEEQNNDSFDWFKSYADLAHLLRELIPNKSSRILMLGCGNSRLSEDMWEDGYCNIVNVDYSGVLIEQMKKRHSTIRPEMEWHEMDVRNLIFEDGSFDVAIDKGTMDAMMTAKGDVWDPPQQVIEDCNKEVDETLRYSIS
uniref:Methyltransferase domain-containing protein n=1 Tax=Psilocybe cubensis TaxID=181762 RepID=A0A8H8CJ10_PSICU